MAIVAVACAVLFAVPEYLRLTILFLGVISMPGPLAVLARYGAPHMRAFGLGGLVAYAAWLVLVGVPDSFFAMRELGQYMAVPLSGFGTNSGCSARWHTCGGYHYHLPGLCRTLRTVDRRPRSMYSCTWGAAGRR
jgi:hypothetical protein